MRRSTSTAAAGRWSQFSMASISFGSCSGAIRGAVMLQSEKIRPSTGARQATCKSVCRGSASTRLRTRSRSVGAPSNTWTKRPCAYPSAPVTWSRRLLRWETARMSASPAGTPSGSSPGCSRSVARSRRHSLARGRGSPLACQRRGSGSVHISGSNRTLRSCPSLPGRGARLGDGAA
jgi:hypothetical protein